MSFASLQSLNKYIPYIIPVIGVLFFGWSAFAVLLFFCVENILQGIFFFLRGTVSVYYGGGVGFLIAFCLLYFGHAIGMTQAIFFLGNNLSIKVIPPLYVIVVNLIILTIPHVQDFFQFASSMSKITPITSQVGVSKDVIREEVEKQDLTPVIDLILNVKEMFLRIFAIWATLPFAFIIVFLSVYFKFLPIINSVLLISVFSFFHYFFDKYAMKERQKIMGGYNSWRTGQTTTSTTESV